VISSIIEATFIGGANILVESDTFSTSHIDLDDALPVRKFKIFDAASVRTLKYEMQYLWSFTFGVSFSYFCLVWAYADLSQNQTELAFITAVCFTLISTPTLSRETHKHHLNVGLDNHAARGLWLRPGGQTQVTATPRD
jgi:hypothetical protein